MKLKRLLPDCREATRLVLEGEERALAPGERVLLRLHWAACGACRRFRGQVALMRGALQQWRDDTAGKR